MIQVTYLNGNQEFSFEEQKAQEQYLQNPLAFWLRPDGDYLSDQPYKPRYRFYKPDIHKTLQYIED